MGRFMKKKFDSTFWILTCGGVLLFAILAAFFPYSGDDWAWGSYLGIDRLKTFYEDYNGRYLGNLLVTALTRSKTLNIIVMSLSCFGACWMCYKYNSNKRNIHLLFALILFFLMPRTVFMQSIVWTAGFSNYVPSVLMSLGYILIIENITGNRVPQYSKYMPISTVLLGFFGALFIENIALFNVCLGFAVIGYTFLKFRKIFFTHIGFFLGSIIGAIWMFSNGAYHNITEGTDGYRNVPKTFEGIIESCKAKGYIICNSLFLSNLLICGMVSLLLVFLTIKFLKKSTDVKRNAIAITSTTANVITMFLFAFRYFFIYSAHHIGLDSLFGFLTYKRWQAVLIGIFIATLFISVLVCVEKGQKFKMLLPVYCVPVMVAPLLVVHPIGPRCFFAPYLMMMVFAVELFGYIIKDVDLKNINYKSLLFSMGVTVIVQAFIFINIFYPIHKYDQKRADFAKLQSANNENEIVVCSLPNTGYVWCSTPNVEPWMTRFKLFYGLDQEAQIKVVTPQEMDKYIEEYEENK